MKEELIKELLLLYDEYINTLRHISSFNLDINEVNRVNGFTSVNEMDNFLSDYINEAHLKLINDVMKKMYGSLKSIKTAQNIRKFIFYPDFNIKTFIHNPATFYKCNGSLEKAVIISPTYELNLVVNDKKTVKGRSSILRIERLALAPKIDIFSYTFDEVNEYLLLNVLNGLIKEFKVKYNADPNKDDIVFLTNVAIQHIFARKNKDNNLQGLYQDDAIISYDYPTFKKNLSQKYNVMFKDHYRSKSGVVSPWIYKELVSFDNREIVKKDEDIVIPLSYMRKR